MGMSEVMNYHFKKRFIMKNSRILIILLPLAVLVAADMIFRFEEIRAFRLGEWSFYTASCIYFLFCVFFIFRILAITKNAFLFYVISVLSILLFSFLSTGSLVFYEYFKTLPNSFTFDYMFTEFRDFKSLLASSVSVPIVILIFSCALGITFLLHKQKSVLLSLNVKRWGAVLMSVYLIVFFFIFNNNVRMYPGCYVPPVNAFFSFTFSIQEHWNGKGAGLRALSQPFRSKLPTINQNPPCNILILLGESSRARSSKAHGYEKNTNPRQTEFLKENNGIIFPRFYSVCTRTMLAFPSFLTGISPSQPVGLLHHEATLFSYARSFTRLNTFVISSQSYDWGNFAQFINDGSLDYLYDSEISGEKQNDEAAIADSLLPGVLGKHLRSIKGPFVGMVHFFITHYPYESGPQDKIFGEDESSKYNESTHSLDRQIGSILDTLKALQLLNNTVVLFTSDHGEALNEHGYSGHLHTFYNEEAQVPAWLYIPAALQAELPEFKERAQTALRNKAINLCNIDVVPTVIDLLGLWDNPNYMSYRKDLLGSPITRLVDSTRFIFMQNYNEVEQNTLFVGMGLLRGNIKYLLHTKNNRLVEEVYNIPDDKEERKNLLSSIQKEDLFVFRNELKKFAASNALLQEFEKQTK